MIVLFFVMLLLLPSAQVFAQGLGTTANGEMALRAIQQAFPDRTGEIAFIDNDWTIRAGEETFFWAGGRLLPQAERDNTDTYGPHSFYVIPPAAAPPEDYPPQYIEVLRARGRDSTRPLRPDSHWALQGILYGGIERHQVEAMLERIVFLDKRVTVHRSIVPALTRIDAAIRAWDDGRNFIASLETIEGYSWRQVAGTQRMSYHSWGLALDIRPARLGSRAIYWQWERGRSEDNWMLVPLENRWNPPDFVIEIFESEGFVWGGKWPMYDNMHFEFRPELHEFTRLMATNPAAGTAGLDVHHVFPPITIRN